MQISIHIGIATSHKTNFKIRQFTAKDLFTTDPTSLSTKWNLSTQEIIQFTTAIASYLSTHNTALRPTRGDTLLHKTESNGFILPTGYEAIDSLLDGGLLSSHVTELSGPPSSGKTQIAMMMAIKTLLDDQTAKVVYIDTNGSCSAARLKSVLERLVRNRNIHENYSNNNELWKSVLQRLEIIRLSDAIGVWDLLSAWLAPSSHTQPPKLIIVDSIGTIGASLLGIPNHQGLGSLATLATLFKSVAKHLAIPILFINNAVSSNRTQYDRKPALGQYWTSVPFTTIWLDMKYHGDCIDEWIRARSPIVRVATVLKCHHHGKRIGSSVEFCI